MSTEVIAAAALPASSTAAPGAEAGPAVVPARRRGDRSPVPAGLNSTSPVMRRASARAFAAGATSPPSGAATMPLYRARSRFERSHSYVNPEDPVAKRRHHIPETQAMRLRFNPVLGKYEDYRADDTSPEKHRALMDAKKKVLILSEGPDFLQTEGNRINRKKLVHPEASPPRREGLRVDTEHPLRQETHNWGNEVDEYSLPLPPPERMVKDPILMINVRSQEPYRPRQTKSAKRLQTEQKSRGVATLIRHAEPIPSGSLTPIFYPDAPEAAAVAVYTQEARERHGTMLDYLEYSPRDAPRSPSPSTPVVNLGHIGRGSNEERAPDAGDYKYLTSGRRMYGTVWQTSYDIVNGSGFVEGQTEKLVHSQAYHQKPRSDGAQSPVDPRVRLGDIGHTGPTTEDKRTGKMLLPDAPSHVTNSAHGSPFAGSGPSHRPAKRQHEERYKTSITLDYVGGEGGPQRPRSVSPTPQHVRDGSGDKLMQSWGPARSGTPRMDAPSDKTSPNGVTPPRVKFAQNHSISEPLLTPVPLPAASKPRLLSSISPGEMTGYVPAYADPSRSPSPTRGEPVFASAAATVAASLPFAPRNGAPARSPSPSPALLAPYATYGRTTPLPGISSPPSQTVVKTVPATAPAPAPVSRSPSPSLTVERAVSPRAASPRSLSPRPLSPAPQQQEAATNQSAVSPRSGWVRSPRSSAVIVDVVAAESALAN